MDRSRFLAALIGPTLAVTCASLIVNPAVVADLVATVAASPTFVFMAGIATLPIGLAIVLAHNVWKGWPIFITLFGWLAVVGGLARILLPAQLAAAAPHMVAQGWAIHVAVVALLILALFLCFKALRP